MSSTLEEGGPTVADTQDTETAERPFLVREFAAEVTTGDGRTVDVRIVPYGERITHNDGYGGVPKGVDYTEEWLPGVFSHQLKAANRVLANFEHEEGIRGVVGHGVALREASDGFHGSFRLHDNLDGEKVLTLIRAGVIDGVSLEALPVKNVRGRDGVVQRAKAHLKNIALTRFAAYSGSKILALREGLKIETTLDEEFLPPEPDPELLERCRRLGISLPQRYEAHPAETDTPSNADGTPEDGTRQTVNTPTSEDESEHDTE